MMVKNFLNISYKMYLIDETKLYFSQKYYKKIGFYFVCGKYIIPLQSV